MNRPRRARPCAICQTVRVIDNKVCSKCRKDFGDQLGQPWAMFAVQNSDETAKLIRRKNSHEISLEGHGTMKGVQ